MARKTKEEALRTKQKLLDSALEIMSERTYASISMTEIAERIGYSKGAIYWHFRNKHDILISLVDYVCAKYEQELEKIAKGESLNGLRHYFMEKLSMPLHNMTFTKLHKLLRHRSEWPRDVDEKVIDMLVERISREREAVENLFRRMQKEGKIKESIDAGEAAGLICAILQGIFMFQLEDNFYKMDFSKHVNTIIDAFEKELSPVKS